jgi:hypothetical protein
VIGSLTRVSAGGLGDLGELSASRSAVEGVEAVDGQRPAALAVVTVTRAKPKSCSTGPRSVSTVWMREIGAIRRSTVNQPRCT